MEKKLISDSQLVADLQREFSHRVPQANKSRAINAIYQKCDQHEVPKLTKSNAVALIRYVRKHGTPEKNIGEAIKKISSTNHPVLSRNDVQRIYNRGFADAKQSEYLKGSEVTKIYKWIFKYMRKALADGHAVRIAGFGRFERYLEQARRFRSLSTHRLSSSSTHYVPKFRPSLILRKDLAGHNTSDSDK